MVRRTDLLTLMKCESLIDSVTWMQSQRIESVTRMRNEMTDSVTLMMRDDCCCKMVQGKMMVPQKRGVHHEDSLVEFGSKESYTEQVATGQMFPMLSRERCVCLTVACTIECEIIEVCDVGLEQQARASSATRAGRESRVFGGRRGGDFGEAEEEEEEPGRRES